MKLKPNQSPGTIEKPATQEVQDLMTARWVADMIGVAAELELADFINAGAKTAEEIAKAKGLHASSLYRLLRGLASYGIFAEQEDGTFAQTPRSDALRKDVPHSAWGMAQLTTRPWAVQTWMELGHSIRAGTPALNQNISETFVERREKEVSQKLCNIGQSVGLRVEGGNLAGALRISCGARLISQSSFDRSKRTMRKELDLQLNTVVEKLNLIINHFDDMRLVKHFVWFGVAK
jgi:hypothetical protein